jgi:hypothetical protein
MALLVYDKHNRESFIGINYSAGTSQILLVLADKLVAIMVPSLDQVNASKLANGIK